MIRSFLFSFLLFVSIIQVSGQDKPVRVEPMFWWVGMKNPGLQLIVYGKGISDAEVTLKYPE